MKVGKYRRWECMPCGMCHTGTTRHIGVPIRRLYPEDIVMLWCGVCGHHSGHVKHPVWIFLFRINRASSTYLCGERPISHCARIFEFVNFPINPDRKKYFLLKDKYFCKDSSSHYLRSKIFEYTQWMRKY